MPVFCRCGVAHLCVNVSVLYGEKLAAAFGIKQIHTCRKIMGKTAYLSIISVETVYQKSGVEHGVRKRLTVKVGISVRYGIVKHIQKKRLVEHHNVGAYVLLAGHDLGILRKIGYHAVVIGINDSLAAGKHRSAEIRGFCNDSNISRVFLMLLNNIRKVKIAYHIAVGKNDKLLLAARYKLHSAHQRLKPCGIKLACAGIVECGYKRRQYHYSAAAARKVPVLTGADVIHQRAVIVVGNDAHLGDSRVYHIGKSKVNQSVSAPERKRRHCALCGHFGDVCVMNV